MRGWPGMTQRIGNKLRALQTAVFLHVVAAIALVALAGDTWSSYLVAVLASLVAGSVSQAVVLWRANANARPALAGQTAADVHATYAIAALLFATAAGVAFGAAAWMPEPQPFDTLPIVVTLVAIAVAELAWLEFALGSVRGLQIAADDAAQPTFDRLAIVSPLLFALAITAMAISSVAGVTLATIALTDGGRTAAVGAVATGLLLLAVAAKFMLELKRHAAGVPVDPATSKLLISAVDRAALQSGAVQTVHDVEAVMIGPGRILVSLQLDFKAGVSAAHMAPVLAKMRGALMAAVPFEVDVVLAPKPDHKPA